MSSHYSTIKAKIKTDLKTISELVEVYDYKKGDLNGYHVACIEEMNGSTEQLSLLTTNREMVWTIRIYQEMEKDGVGAKEAESRIDTIVDKIWDLFDNQWKMNCEVNNAFISRISTSWEDREVSMRIIEVDLTIVKLNELT